MTFDEIRQCDRVARDMTDQQIMFVIGYKLGMVLRQELTAFQLSEFFPDNTLQAVGNGVCDALIGDTFRLKRCMPLEIREHHLTEWNMPQWSEAMAMGVAKTLASEFGYSIVDNHE